MAQEKSVELQEELKSRFLTYALSTIVSRSLPDVRDGLKPIHRRILYAIDQMGVSDTAKHVKSAKIIGEVLGKYHPHGDASTYESMVRMAQDFAMRYPLVDGKGNFGSVDGDPAAAYRYTEGRLTAITSFFLADLKKDTVDYKPNYDNTLKEPEVLPSQVPNLLVNGSSGIAVGMACNFPSHNLKEVNNALSALIDKPDMTVAELMQYIKGPDFPTKGRILSNKKELRKVYEDGLGAVRVRGEWSVEDLPRGKQQLILNSLPYGVNKAKLIERVAEIIIAKKLPQLTDIRDESDEENRIVLEIKTGSDPEKIARYLLKHTDLEVNIQLNFNCLTPEGKPERLSLKEICQYFLDFRKEVNVRRLKYELGLLLKRLHILAALVKIFNDLDKALKLIRSSTSRKEAHEKIKIEFAFDDDQTSAILEMPLYRLVSLEIDKILKEQKEKNQEKKKIEGILKSQKKIWGQVKQELEKINEKFGDKRKTKIKSEDTVEFNAEDFIEQEESYFIVSANGWLRKLKSIGDPSTLRFKENDRFLESLKVDSRDLLAFFTNKGMVYTQKSYQFPYTRGGFGEPIQNIFKFTDGEKILKAIAISSAGKDPEESQSNQGSLDFGDNLHKREFMTASSIGYGFRFDFSNPAETTRSGRKFASLKSGSELVDICEVSGSHAFLASKAGKGLCIALEEVPILSGPGAGVKLIKMIDSELAGFKCVNEKDSVTLVFENEVEKSLKLNQVPVYSRGSQGVIVSKRRKIFKVK